MKESLRRLARHFRNDGKVKAEERRGEGREEEQDFPRGGHSVLTPLEKKVIREQATKDTLFNEVRQL